VDAIASAPVAIVDTTPIDAPDDVSDAADDVVVSDASVDVTEASSPRTPTPPPSEVFGNECGGARGPCIRHGPRIPQLRQGTTQVNGRLAPEVIQRVVRQQQSRVLACYKLGLQNNPSLQGRVTTKFVIDREGAVSLVADGGSDLPDQAVIQCVVRVFGSLRFPKPDGGIVTVVYPWIFNPGD